MDILGWIVWLLLKVLGFAWTLAWFLVGGWVSTLAQIAVIVLVVYALKYGWRRAPIEIWSRTRSFGAFFWSWLRARDLASAAVEVRETVRIERVKEVGDVNLSTMLTLVMLIEIVLLALSTR